MSIIGFIIGRNRTFKDNIVITFHQWGIIIIGIIITIAQANLSSENIGGMERTVSSTILLGAVLIGLGVVKTMHDKKIMSSKKETSSV